MVRFDWVMYTVKKTFLYTYTAIRNVIQNNILTKTKMKSEIFPALCLDIRYIKLITQMRSSTTLELLNIPFLVHLEF